MGGFVYASPLSVDFFDKVVEYLDQHDRRPFIDQRALYEVYKSKTGARIFDISKDGWLDWLFNPTSLVWTAKGERRRRDPFYVRERLKFERRGWLISTLILLGYRLRVLRT